MPLSEGSKGETKFNVAKLSFQESQLSFVWKKPDCAPMLPFSNIDCGNFFVLNNCKCGAFVCRQWKPRSFFAGFSSFFFGRDACGCHILRYPAHVD